MKNEITDETDWKKFIASLDFRDELVRELEQDLKELVREVAADAPRDTGRFARGFLQPDTVVVKKEDDAVDVNIKNDVPYSGFVRDEDGDIYIETALFDKVGDVAQVAVVKAIADVLRKKAGDFS